MAEINELINTENINLWYLPAMTELSHPCNKFPTAAATATNTAPLIFSSVTKYYFRNDSDHSARFAEPFLRLCISMHKDLDGGAAFRTGGHQICIKMAITSLLYE